MKKLYRKLNETFKMKAMIYTIIISWVNITGMFWLNGFNFNVRCGEFVVWYLLMIFTVFTAITCKTLNRKP